MPAAPDPLRVDVIPQGLAQGMAQGLAQGLALDEGALARRLARLPIGAPVVVMIHGYSFAPNQPGLCPHDHILSMNPAPGDARAVSWPRHLMLDGNSGLGIAFGWQARGTVLAAYRRAEAAGRALAELADLVSRIDPGRSVDVIAHSLGVRVALAALPHARPGTLRRLILLAGAETRRPAHAAMNSAAGQVAQIVNITTRENDLFDFLVEWLVALGLDTAIGQGIGRSLPNWTDVQIDQPATRCALSRLGYDLPQTPSRISHWSPYLRPGLFRLYRALLEGSLPLAQLAAALPARPDRRWSRLLWPRQGLPLPADPA